MKIGIDGRLWAESGVGRYIRNLVLNLGEIDKENNYFILLLKKNFLIKLPNNFTKVEADFGWYGVKEQILLPNILDSLKPDLVHFPHFNVPLFYNGKFMVTIHDLIHQHFQMRRATTRDPLTYKLKQAGYKTIFKKAILGSRKIIVPSNFIRKQLVDEWAVKESKVVVTYEAVDDKILTAVQKVSLKDSAKIIKELGVKPPFIFYVGNAHPHKNVEGLIKAFIELRKNYQYLQLVLSGQDHYFWKKIRDKMQEAGGKSKDVLFTGFITDEQLVALYKNAQCFVMPSFEEGFGIPLLEAMANGCPVVASNIGALKEVGGDAAIYFDPYNLEDMVEKITWVLNDQIPPRHPERSSEGSNIRKKLIEKGEKRYKDFNWKKLAEQTLQIYNS